MHSTTNSPAHAYNYRKGVYFLETLGKSASFASTLGKPELFDLLCDGSLGATIEAKRDICTEEETPESI